MPKTSLSSEQILSLLSATPQRIAELTEGMAPGRLRVSPGDGQWSVVDVLAHLRSCADVWGEAIATILAEDHPTIRAIDPRTWEKETDYPKIEFGPSFQTFALQRAELLTRLGSLSPEGWMRSATVTGAGKPLERTVWSYAQRMARHERSHVKQIAKITRSRA